MNSQPYVVTGHTGAGHTEQSSPARSGFMVSPLYDSIFFIASPMIALAIGLVLGYLCFPALLSPEHEIRGGESWIVLFIAVWTYSHLCAVGFRSHVNQKVYAQFRYRFTLVPGVLFICLLVSERLMITAFVVIVFWDIYHSAMQNFGFCRIYDAKQGNPADEGRELDITMNLLLYIGPIVGGAGFVTTLNFFDAFTRAGWDAPIKIAKIFIYLQSHLQTLVLAVGTVFLIYYFYRYQQLRQQGYRFSPQKLCLLVSVGITSVWAWVFLSPFLAFFIINFYHALQYFAIVWAREKNNIRSLAGISESKKGRNMTFAGFTAILLLAGLAYQYSYQLNIRWAMAFFSVVALMHFWYDGFIWSVRRKEVE